MATDQLARGLAARTFATARANSISVEEFGARTTGDSRAAIQRAINLAVASGIPKVTSRLPRMELWDQAVAGSSNYFLLDRRLLTVPACNNLDIDFGNAAITLKGPGGGARYPGQPVTDIGFGTLFMGGFISLFSTISGTFSLRNVDVDGGFTGDTVGQANFTNYDKGFYAGDTSIGKIVMENVTLHGFAGEIMYDNSSVEHLSRDCHFYNSGHSCWNPNGVGKVVAYNLQAGITRQVTEIVGGHGHTYYGGRFYKSGGGGSTVIGGPDPAFAAPAYNYPHRRTDAPPPYIQFVGTRFEEFASYLYIGSYVRGSILTTDVPVFIAPGFASSTILQDTDLDIYATIDRTSAISAVSVYDARNTNVRVHMSRTAYAVTQGNSFQQGLLIGDTNDSTTCDFSVDGIGNSFAFEGATPGNTRSFVHTQGARETSAFIYFNTDQTYRIDNPSVILYPTGAGTFNFVLDTTINYTAGQEFTFYHDGSGSADRIVSFAKNGAGMKLNADRTLRRAGDYLTLRRAPLTSHWVEAAYVGEAGPQTIPVLAAAMIANTTNGPAAGLSESGTNKVMLATLDFDATTSEAAQIAIPMPRSWNEGTVQIQFVWTAAGGGSAVWGCQALALSDDDVLDAPFGLAQTVTDAVTAVGDMMESAFTALLTIAGSPAPEDLVVFRLFRDANNAADTLTADARLVAVRIRYTADTENDA